MGAVGAANGIQKVELGGGGVRKVIVERRGKKSDFYILLLNVIIEY